MKSKCDCLVDVVNGVICVEDKDLGNISVTNDIENVVADLRDHGFLVYNYPLIYRDSLGYWDGVKVVGGEFHSFVTFGGIHDKDTAIAKAKELQQQNKL